MISDEVRRRAAAGLLVREALPPADEHEEEAVVASQPTSHLEEQHEALAMFEAPDEHDQRALLGHGEASSEVVALLWAELRPSIAARHDGDSAWRGLVQVSEVEPLGLTVDDHAVALVDDPFLPSDTLGDVVVGGISGADAPERVERVDPSCGPSDLVLLSQAGPQAARQPIVRVHHT